LGTPLKLGGEEARISVKVILEVLKLTRSPRFSGQTSNLDLARVLLVHGELAPRLALSTILQAGGYAVDVAASPSEALAKLDEGAYDLVLSDGEFGMRPLGADLLAYARVKDYHPATALITSDEPRQPHRSGRGKQQISVYTENVPSLLGKVADLIGIRATRRYRPARQAV
jgi:CheY-like chemotaxis protein